MSWIDHYCEFVSENEPPYEFNFWCAMAAIGHVLGRKVWLQLHNIPTIYPGQCMVLLCADSAISRKTSAMMNVATFLNTLPHDFVHIVAQHPSPATILDELNRTDELGEKLDAVGLIFVGELAEFFGRGEVHQQLPTLVTTLNDAPHGLWRAPTRHWGNVELLNPCLGMVAGVTRTGLAEEVPNMVRKTGFLGRCVVVDSDGPTKAFSGVYPPRQFAKLRLWLLNDLHRRLVGIAGPFEWEPDAMAWYDTWYTAYFAVARSSTFAQGTGWLGRKHVHLLRTAMILTCAVRNDRVMRVDMLERALREVERVERRMGYALQEVGASSQDLERKKKLLLKCYQLGDRNGADGWVPKRKLFQYMKRWYARGTYTLFVSDLHDAEHAGDMVRRHNAKGQCEEWKVTGRKGQMLSAVADEQLGTD